MSSMSESYRKKPYFVHHNTILGNYPYRKNIIRSIKHNNDIMFINYIKKIRIAKRLKKLFLNRWLRLCTIHGAYLVRAYLEKEYE
jgi:hypothetical protein